MYCDWLCMESDRIIREFEEANGVHHGVGLTTPEAATRHHAQHYSRYYDVTPFSSITEHSSPDLVGHPTADDDSVYTFHSPISGKNGYR